MPIDFTLPNPMGAVNQGLAASEFMNQQQRDAQQREAAAVAQQRMNQDLAQVLAKGTPTASDYAALTVKYPQFNEQFNQAWEMLSEEQKTNRVSQASEVYAALEAGEPGVAQELLEFQAQAAENSGDSRSAKSARVLAEMINMNPETAKTSVALRLSAMMGPEKFTETFTGLEADRRSRQLEEAVLTEKEAEAYKAAVEADYADSNAAIDLQKKGWDIWKIQDDSAIARENSRIAALNAQLKRETNDLKRQELQAKKEEMERKRDQAIQQRAAQAETAALGIDNSLSTIDRLLKNPELDNVLGSMEGRRFYPSVLIGALNPFASGDKRADAIADVETVQGQQFISNLMNAKERGATFGSLTEREGAKLEGYIKSLNRKQSEQQFRDNLREIQRMLLKSRSIIYDKSGIPETIPDTPDVETPSSDIDALVQKYSGDQ